MEFCVPIIPNPFEGIIIFFVLLLFCSIYTFPLGPAEPREWYLGMYCGRVTEEN